MQQLILEQIEKKKNLTLVVDCEHAYAILKVWLDNFWAEVRGEKRPDVLLRCLVEIATSTQLVCEQLNFVQEALTENEAQDLRQTLPDRMLHVLNDILYRTKSSPSLQKDGPSQYCCDFDQASLHNMKDMVDELRSITRTQ